MHVMAAREDIPESQSGMGREENSPKSKTFPVSSILDKGAVQPGERQVGDRRMACPAGFQACRRMGV